MEDGLAAPGTHTSIARENVNRGLLQVNAALSINGNLSLYGQDPETDKKLFFQDLLITNPNLDKKRIERAKGGLLQSSHNWILDDAGFQRWRDDRDVNLIWVHGGPGMGKTMLLCGILDELKRPVDTRDDLVSFFFCENSNNDSNSATSVLRGLMYMLVDKNPWIVKLIQGDYNKAGAKLFEGRNSWYSVREVFVKVLQHLVSNSHTSGGDSEKRDQAVVYLAIDALDECTTDLNNLLDLIAQETSLFHSSTGTTEPRYRVKWLVSSRMLPSISKRLGVGKTGTRYGIDLNKHSKDISRAVDAFVDRCADDLEPLVGTDRNGSQLREDVRHGLCGGRTGGSNSRVDMGRSGPPPTFLYVSLVFAKLKKAATSAELRTALGEVASDVVGLYTQAVDHITYLPSETKELCRNVLSAVTVAYRPLKRQELYFLSGLSFPPIRDDDSNRQYTFGTGAAQDEVLVACDTFLTVRAEDDTAYFVHQSAKDFLCSDHRSVMSLFGKSTRTEGGGGGIARNHLEHEHYRTFLTSIHVLNGTLTRNMFGLTDRACSVDQIELPEPNPLAAVSYSATYWIAHLLASGHHGPEVQDDGLLSQFLKTKLLYWLECLALVRGIRQALISWAKLVDFIQGGANTAQLTQQILDAHGFIAYHNRTIMTYPLQAYESALIFSPSCSQTRVSFWAEEPNWVAVASATEEKDWSPWVQTLDHGTAPSSLPIFESLKFSPDDTLLAASILYLEQPETPVTRPRLGTIKIYDVATGLCRWTLHDTESDWVGFPPGNSTLLTIEFEGEVKFFDMVKGCWTARVLAIGDISRSAAFSSDGVWLAVAMNDGGENRISIWDWARGDRASRFQWHSATAVQSLVFSPCGTRLATADRREICIWNPESGTRDRVISINTSTMDLPGVLVGFSPDGRKLISANPKTLETWNPETGERLQHLDMLDEGESKIALSPDSSLVAVSEEGRIKVWDVRTRRRLQTVRSYERNVHSIAFSTDGTWLACAGGDGINICRGRPVITGTKDDILDNCEFGALVLRDHEHRITLLRISANNRTMVSFSEDTIRIWDLLDARCLGQITGTGKEPAGVGFIYDAAISPDGTKLAGAKHGAGIQIWDLEKIENTTAGSQPFQTINESALALSFSSSGPQVLTFVNLGGGVRIWDLDNKRYLEQPAKLSIKSGLATAEQDQYGACAVSPKDSRRVAISSARGQGCGVVSIINPGLPGRYPPSLQKLISDYKDGNQYIRAICFSSNGYFIAALADEIISGGNGNGNKISVIKVWKLNTDSRRYKFPLQVHRTLKITTSGGDSVLRGISRGSIAQILAFETSSPTGGQGRLLTNVGLFTFDLDATYTDWSKVEPLVPGQEKQNRHLHVHDAGPSIINATGYGVDIQGGWITYNSERVLFLPEEYLPFSANAVCVAGLPTTGTGEVTDPCMVILGCRSGKVVILRFPEAPGPVGAEMQVLD